MHGQFIKDMTQGTDKEKLWLWMRKYDLKIPPKYYHMSNTTFVSVDSTSCRMCCETGETISHIMSKCSNVAQTEYKTRHGIVSGMVHWKLCKKFSLEESEK